MSGRGVAETGQLRAKLETQVWRLLQCLDISTQYLLNIYTLSTHLAPGVSSAGPAGRLGHQLGPGGAGAGGVAGHAGRHGQHIDICVDII